MAKVEVADLKPVSHGNLIQLKMLMSHGSCY